jgi:hypothetical protein
LKAETRRRGSPRHREWARIMSDVQSNDSMANGSEISEFGSRSSVSISSMAGEPSGASAPLRSKLCLTCRCHIRSSSDLASCSKSPQFGLHSTAPNETESTDSKSTAVQNSPTSKYSRRMVPITPAAGQHCATVQPASLEDTVIQRE